MKTKFYSIKTCFLFVFLALGIGQTVNAQTIQLAINNSTTGGDGTIALTGEVLKYFIQVKNGPQEILIGAHVADLIPQGTVYVQGTTTLNGVAVPDVNGEMPYASFNGALINSPGSQAGICDFNTTTTLIFQVKVVASAGAIRNAARVYETDPSVTFDQFTNMTTTNVQANSVCSILYTSFQSTVGTKRFFNQLRTYNKATGSISSAMYDGRSGACEDINGNVLSNGTLFTNASAMAFDRAKRRIYFINDDTTTAQDLCYLDMNRATITAVTFGTQLEAAAGAGYNITRMVTGTNGTFYALTDNNRDLISFSFGTGAQPVITRSGALVNSASNGAHDILTETGGDMVCDGTGRLILITGTNNVYAINPLTNIAQFIGGITGITMSSVQRTTSAAIDNEGNTYVGGNYGRLYLVSLVNFTATQVGTALTEGVGDYATCGLPIQPLRVATNEKPIVSNPVITRNSEVYAKVQPNPFHSELNLQVQLNTTEKVQVKLIDFFGRTVFTTSEKLTAGVNSLHLPVPANLVAGIYVVELWTGEKRLLQKKLVKQ